MSRYVRPYGDTTGDGMIQTSFTLPIPFGPKADGAAQQEMGPGDPVYLLRRAGRPGYGRGQTFAAWMPTSVALTANHSSAPGSTARSATAAAKPSST